MLRHKKLRLASSLPRDSTGLDCQCCPQPESLKALNHPGSSVCVCVWSVECVCVCVSTSACTLHRCVSVNLISEGVYPPVYLPRSIFSLNVSRLAVFFFFFFFMQNSFMLWSGGNARFLEYWCPNSFSGITRPTPESQRQCWRGNDQARYQTHIYVFIGLTFELKVLSYSSHWKLSYFHFNSFG